ncbi:exonuclease domain-containing protein [Streptosporangium sp. NPDC000239]|uniref:exonuclease domain-containing protein n=1 Tax=Streptosporangium sp. NPDC000239 TaxID=3154248 RepID=UPI00332EED3E
MGWHLAPMASADTETSGISIETDRILTAAVIAIDPARRTRETTFWVLDPGIDVPATAAEIHGYDTARIRAEGRKDVAAAIGEIADAVMAPVHAGIPLIVYNAPYDLSLIDRETRRYGLEPLEDRLRAATATVVDPFVLDKALDKYRPGKRTLTAVSEHYRVPVGEDAHGAEADALASARVAYRLCQKFPKIAQMPLAELHALQVRAKAEQAASFRAYLTRQGKAVDGVRDEWPLVPYTAPTSTS